jgi:hypothetical protein
MAGPRPLSAAPGVRRPLLRLLARLTAPRAPATAPEPPTPLEDVPAGGPALDLARLLAGRDSAARQTALRGHLERRGVPFTAHAFATPEGRGETFAVDVGPGPRTLVLCAHHDAVPGSPGANDNAAAVGILLHLLPRLPALAPPGVRVRLLFTACEELDYLGAREYVRTAPLGDVAGVLSLELCGIGDALALWDAGPETPFLETVTRALDGLGLRRDAGYHVLGRIPLFGSDHRAFAAAGIPAYGLSIAPLAHADALRRLVLSPVRGALGALVRRPAPFDTYHTAADRLATLEPAALDRVGRALEAIVAGLDRRL